MRQQPILFKCLAGILVFAALPAFSQPAPAKHAFTAKDWPALRSASAAAVSPDGLILYGVAFGGDKGPTHHEWWTITADGAHGVKLDLPDGFTPAGFTPAGSTCGSHSLYGTWKVNGTPQFAIFALKDGKAAAAPSTLVALPRGIESVSAGHTLCLRCRSPSARPA